MLLEKLTIKDYGVYAGRSEFDLSTSPEKPIVLVGGLNGAGKTTMFESLMVGLYGKTYLGRRTTKKEYSKFILKRFHRHGDVRADDASIEVTFRFYHNGCEDEYLLRRSWRRDGASVAESLVIEKNGELMNDVDESQWQSFIEGLLPLGIARLFFFDGEKITRMTKWDNPDNDEIRSSLDMLLGTDLINRLYSDLDLYMVRKSGRTGNTDKMLEKEYKEMKKEKDSLASEIEIMRIERDKKKEEVQSLTSDVGIKESKIAGVGGGYADIRGDLLSRRAACEESLKSLNKTIQEGLGGDAPMYLVSPLLERIKSKVEAGTESRRWREASNLIQDIVSKIKKEMVSNGSWSVGVEQEKAYERVFRRLDESLEPSKDEEFFDLAPSDAMWLLGKIDQIATGSDTLQEHIQAYGKAVKKLEGIESDLAKIPKDDEIGPRISEINSLHQEIGMLKSEIIHIDQELSSKDAYQKILQNKLKGLIDSIHKGKVADAGVYLAADMQRVLVEYSKNLRERKIRDLESNLLDSVRSLLHKKHIHRIEIDRKTLEIRAYENDNDESPGTLKSMGERQIVGTALLWAIAKTSGRSLPFVIDTPLGRLDGKHLSNLTSRFYPFASHQLVLLSTDREIGPNEYKQLSNHTSRSYRITCNEEMSVTTLAEGYFEVEN